MKRTSLSVCLSVTHALALLLQLNEIALVRVQVLRMVRGAKLVGQSVIAYLQKRGYPEVCACMCVKL